MHSSLLLSSLDNPNNNAKAYAYNKTISHIYFHNVLILLDSLLRVKDFLSFPNK